MQYRRITDSPEIRAFIERCNEAAESVVIDLETTGLNPRVDKILDVVVADSPDSAVIFSDPAPLKDLRCPVIFHNCKFDLHMLFYAGIDLRSLFIRDTMLIHHLLDEEASHRLDDILQTEFGDNYKEVFWSKYDRYQDAPEEERTAYACKDAIYTYRLYNTFNLRLGVDEIPDALVNHVHRLALSLLDTEITGIAVDQDYLVARGVELQAKIAELGPKMRSMVEYECKQWELEEWSKELDKRKTPKGKANVERPQFSFDSPKQLSDLLYRRLGLPLQYDQKTRKVTTGDDALLKLEDAHPLIPVLREYKGHQKVYTAYIEGTRERMFNGRIYPEFNVNGTKTGRISHSNPNMGQLPATGGIRGIYVADPGYYILSADYKQLEVTLAAHFSRDPNLLRVVLEGASLHDITSEALKIERGVAKTLNFAIQYGAGVSKVQKILQCTREEAEGALRKYWETYPGLKRLIDECHYKVECGQPIVSPFGRKRRFPTEFENHWEKERAKRQAFNALIQGTGGDLTSRAFYLTDYHLKEAFWGKGLLTVHDELLIHAKQNKVEQAKDLMLYQMQLVGKEIGLTVPLSAECSEPSTRWED